jgi:tRNA pseudouridine38-40 synthase
VPDGSARAALRIVLSYDGTDFHGSQRQSGRRTVQGELERVLSHLAGTEIPATLAGRTDEGVHAAGQVASVTDIRPAWDEIRYLEALNALLPVDCGVARVERVAPDFHARYDATWREYRFRIWNGSSEPLARRQTWQRRGAIDRSLMDEAARRLVGTHDFASFAGGGEGVPWSQRHATKRGTTRTVLMSSVRPLSPWWADRRDGQLIEVRIVADGFLPRMVRTIAGVLVEIGQRRRDADWIDTLLAGRDRRLAGETAPPQGLTLWRVGYAGDLPDDGAGEHE